MATTLHHTSLVTHDMDAALRFYRDGLGLEVAADYAPQGDFATLFDAPSGRLRSVVLHGPADHGAGTLELVAFEGTDGAPPPVDERPGVGFFLLAFFVDLDAVEPRLAELGHSVVRSISVDGRRGATMRLAVVRDPHGVLVELVDVGPGAGTAQ